MYYLRQAEDLVLANCRYPDDKSMRVRARNWLQETYDEICGNVIIPSLEDTFDFSLVQGEYTKRMPIDTAGVINVRVMSKGADPKLNWPLDEWNPDEMDWDDPNVAGGEQGDPSEYRVQTINGILADDLNVQDYYIRSSHGDDNANVSVVLYLDAAQSRRQNFTVKLNGVEQVFIGRGYKCIAASKMGDTKGYVTVEKRLLVPATATTPAPPPPIPLPGTIALVNAETAKSDAVAGSLVVTAPAGVIDGDMLILHISAEASALPGRNQLISFIESTLVPVGFQPVPGTRPGRHPAVPGELASEVYYKVANSEPADYTITWPEGVNCNAILSAWRGVDTANPWAWGFHTQLNNQISGQTPVTGFNFTTPGTATITHYATPNDVVLTEPTGYTEVGEIKSDAGGGNVIATQAIVQMSPADVVSDYSTHTGGVGLPWSVSYISLFPSATAVTPPSPPTSTVTTQWLAVSEIGPQDAESQLFTLEVRDICITAFTFQSRFVRKPPRLMNPSDTFFFIPGTFHQMIIEGAISRGEKFIEDSRRAASEAEYFRLWRNFIKAFKPLRVKKMGFSWPGE